MPAKGILPPGIMGYRPALAGIAYDPVKARKLISDAGYGDGSKLPPLEICYRQDAADARVATTAVAGALSQTLNFKVQPHAYDFGTLLGLQHMGKLQMSFCSWYADYLDPQNFLSLLLTTGVPQNAEGWSNAQFDDLCSKADVDVNDTEREALYQGAEEIAVNEVAKLPLYFQRDAVLISPRVSGIRSNLFGDLPHLTVRVSG
jgi:ABC-type transport system substrate-binding protein